MFEHLDDPNPPEPDDTIRHAVAARAARRRRRRQLVLAGSAASVILVGSLTAFALAPADHHRTKVATTRPSTPPTIPATTMVPTTMPPATVPGPLACAPLTPANPPAGTRRTATVVLGEFTATLSGLSSEQYGQPILSNPTLTVQRGGVTTVSGPQAPAPQAPGFTSPTPFNPWPIDGTASSSAPLCVARFAGRADPVVLLGLTWGGAHCCIFLRAIDVGTGASVQEELGNAGVAVQRDADHALVVTADNNFAYAFSSFAASGMPIVVQELRAGGFVDVTRQHPDLITADAAQWWSAFKPDPQYGDDGLLAAWVADECLLGNGPAAFTRLDQLETQGKLVQPSPFPSGADFVNKLHAFLAQHGYC